MERQAVHTDLGERRNQLEAAVASMMHDSPAQTGLSSECAIIPQARLAWTTGLGPTLRPSSTMW